MATMTIRYDDGLEVSIDKLKNYYRQETKNKVIIKIIKEHMQLVEKNELMRKQNYQLTAELRMIKSAVRKKINADKELAALDLND